MNCDAFRPPSACWRRSYVQIGIDLSDMSDAMDFGTGGSMVPRCVTDLKPCVYDALLRGSGA
jgi:hypothetical protein